MRVVKINTTAFEEEDFFIMTTLTDDQIAEVISPIINQERDGYEEYDNDILVSALKERFGDNTIEQITIEYFSL